MSSTEETRVERDSMGEMRVPANAYYGASTQRAVLNFPISDLRFPRQFIRALGQIKQAAAETNVALGTTDPQIAEAIVDAAQEVIGVGIRRTQLESAVEPSCCFRIMLLFEGDAGKFNRESLVTRLQATPSHQSLRRPVPKSKPRQRHSGVVIELR